MRHVLQEISNGGKTVSAVHTSQVAFPMMLPPASRMRVTIVASVLAALIVRGEPTALEGRIRTDEVRDDIRAELAWDASQADVVLQTDGLALETATAPPADRDLGRPAFQRIFCVWRHANVVARENIVVDGWQVVCRTPQTS